MRWMNVSNSMNAYGRRLVDRSCDVGYVVLNSLARSERYVNANFRGYDRSEMQKYMMSEEMR